MAAKAFYPHKRDDEPSDLSGSSAPRAPRKTGRDLLEALGRAYLSEETLDALEAQVRARRESPARTSQP
jgi:hypothetical protein